MIINKLAKITVVIVALSFAGCSAKEDVVEPAKLTPVPQLIEQGDRKMQSKQYVSSVFFYNQALEQEPNNIEAMLGVADANMEVDNLAEANKIYEKILAGIETKSGDKVLISEPEKIRASEGKALVYFKRYDYERAKQQLVNVLNDDDSRWRSWNALGIIADLEGHQETAQQYFNKAIEIDKTNAIVLNNLGYSLMMSKQYEQAEKVFREGLNYEPGFFRIRNNLAISLAWQSRYDEAISTLTKVVKHEVAYNNVGYIAMLNKQYKVAEDYFKKALFVSPSYYVRAARNLEKLESIKKKEALTEAQGVVKE